MIPTLFSLIIWIGIVSLFLLGLLLSYIHTRKNYLILSTQEQSTTPEPLSPQQSSPNTIDEYFKDLEILQLQQKLASLSQHWTGELEPHDEYSTIQDETNLIKEGELQFQTFEQELHNAIPTSDVEKEQDLHQLSDTLHILEKWDGSYYQKEDHQDMGKGMLIDSISRKLSRIINSKNFTQWAVLQAEKLELAALEEIKTLDHEQFLETLRIMSETRSIQDFFEINPHLHIIQFKQPIVLFTAAEKVIIALASEYSPLTLNRITRITRWKRSYITEILDSLRKKGIISSFSPDNIIIEGLLSPDEAQARKALLKQKESQKQDKTLKIQEITQAQQELTSKLTQKEEEQQIELLQKRQNALLEEARSKVQVESQLIREEAELVTEMEEIERLDKIKSSMILPTKRTKAHRKTRKTPEQSVTGEALQEQISQEIQTLFDTLIPLTGGMITFSALLEKLNEGSFPDLQSTDLEKIVELLKVNKQISVDYTISGIRLLHFSSINLDKEMQELIPLFIYYGELAEEQLHELTKWSLPRIQQVINRFLHQHLLKINQKKHYYLPGLYNARDE